MPENEEIIGLCPEKPKGKTANEELRLKTANLVLSQAKLGGDNRIEIICICLATASTELPH